MYFSLAHVISAVLFLLAFANDASAFWRLPCRGRTGVARIDPLANFGQVGDHAHVIHGGGNFGMTSEQGTLNKSDCTSCAVKQDMSAYWTPALYFMGSDGKTQLVEQVGGMLAYYLLYGDNIKAFPDGFQMIAGDTRRRNFTLPVPDPPKSSWSGDDSTQDALGQKAVGFNCLNYAKDPEASLYRHFLPDKAYLDANCADGVRLELMFPSCWNGKDVDSPNHKDHMAYPTLVMTGTCPPGFETRLVSLFYETIWDTSAFKGQDGQFMLANGDPTGYGYHGDFIAAWEEGFLQQAVDTCTNPSGQVQDCPLFDLQDDGPMGNCKLDMPSQLKDEDCTDPSKGLPGNVPIQRGPQYASNVGSGGSHPASKSAAVPIPTASASVPVLTYSAATAKVTDKYGGGIFVASSSIPALSPTTAPTQVENKAVAIGGQGKPVATTIYTIGREVFNVVIVEEEKFVTVDSLPTKVPTYRKRHAHGHGHARH